jgi:hypothetical protein
VLLARREEHVADLAAQILGEEVGLAEDAVVRLELAEGFPGGIAVGHRGGP